MQPTFILTRTFAICGLLVGGKFISVNSCKIIINVPVTIAASLALAAPVRASPRGDVQIRDPVSILTSDIRNGD